MANNGRTKEHQAALEALKTWAIAANNSLRQIELDMACDVLDDLFGNAHIEAAQFFTKLGQDYKK